MLPKTLKVKFAHLQLVSDQFDLCGNCLMACKNRDNYLV